MNVRLITTTMGVWLAATVATAVEPTCELTVTLGEQSYPLRCDVILNRKSLTEEWDAFLGRLFDDHDRDGDGRLSPAEVRYCPSTAWLRAQVRGEFANVPEICTASDDFFGRSESITRDDFVAAYRRAGATGVEVRTAPPAKRDDRVNRALFVLLTGGEDKPLVEASFLAANETLHRLDADDDERIAVDELLPVVRRLKIKPELPASLHPGVDGKSTATVPRLDVIYFDPPSAGSFAGIGSYRGELPKFPFAFDFVPGLADGPFRSAFTELRQQLETDDADGDGALSPAEMQASPNADTWQALARGADRDYDGRLTTAELDRCCELLAQAAALRVEVMLVDRGRPLFDVLDVDRDGRLTPREQRHGWPRLAHWDSNRDGSIVWDEVPRLLQLVFSRGSAKPEASVAAKPTVVAAPRGPAWFTKMDRNGDGDLTAGEFLGPSEVFRKLDTDADGLLDAAEARR